MPQQQLAPAWTISHWLNTPKPLALGDLHGKAVFAVAFQMLCPGCVSHGLPQAMRARQAFASDDLAVIGLHTVFEHHEAQGTPQALAAFLHEYKITFPVGIDAQSRDRIPQTMRAYQMQGTPTTLLFDRSGQLRLQKFGHLDDLRLGAALQTLIGEKAPEIGGGEQAKVGACDDGACPVE